MKKSAERMDFERAAELRDMVEDLKKTLKPTRTFERNARGRVLSTIEPMADVRELQEELGLPNPPLIMECFDIANIGTAHCVASMVRFKNGAPDNANYRRYRIRIVSGQNDFAAMREVVRRRYSRILLEGRERLGAEGADATQEGPLESMRRLERMVESQTETQASAGVMTSAEDGLEPNPQSAILNPQSAILNSSSASPISSSSTAAKASSPPPWKNFSALAFQVQDLPVIGLAKEEEEIFRPDRAEPLRLSHDTGALKLLQRIRDEAHRWANGYHQLLLNRRVKESVLDDCPWRSK